MGERGFSKIFGRNAESDAAVKTEVKNQPQAKEEGSDHLEEYEGQLAIDVHQTDDDIVIKTPIAGVRAEDLDLSITDDVVTISGERKRDEKIEDDAYLVQECYWGSFSRSYILPVAVDADNASASIKDGVLTVAIPKEAKSKTRVIQVQEGK